MKFADVLDANLGYCLDDSIVVNVTLTAFEKVVVMQNAELYDYHAGTASSFSASYQESMRDLYLKRIETDFAVHGEDGKAFQVHKGILMARSSVFRAMFSSEMAEKEAHYLVIPDIESEVLTSYSTRDACNLLNSVRL